MTPRNRTTAWLRAGLAAATAAASLAVPAQQAAPAQAAPWTLRQAFDAAWARQPEAVALPARREAARAQQGAASAWTPEPAALEVSNKTDRLHRNDGARELALGVAVPLWLPGERSRSTALADAEGAAIESRAAAAQLRLAATVREAWWQWQRARIDADIAREQFDGTRRIAADVARRMQAGDLARADQHQADGAVATAEARLAEADAGLAAARQQLRALTGSSTVAADSADPAAEPEPGPGADADDLATHAALQALQDQALVAQRSAALAGTRSRANPELLLATTRERGAAGEPAQQTLTLGLRIPFGAGPRHDARLAAAHAEAGEAQAQLALERERLAADRESARVRLAAARLQQAAAERRARLATESRGFFDQSFRLGETDLPMRLRIEAEAAEAERQAARTRIDVAAALSAWRQALGLLPQ